MAKYKIIIGACEEVMPTLGRQFDLVFADPPFNIGHPYVGFSDNIPEREYRFWTHQWVKAAWDRCSGVMCLHGPDYLAEMYLLAMYGQTRVAWVQWHYRFGQNQMGNWVDDRCHCLVYAKHKNFTWNPGAVLVQSDRVAYGDKRVEQTGGRRVPGTSWGVPSDGTYWGRVQGNNKERRPGHPNQLPELYLERIILAYSNPGDYVLDPFCGSGTTLVVANALGRHCLTIDKSAENATSARQRAASGAIRVPSGRYLQ